jgi:hypothetical protein
LTPPGPHGPTICLGLIHLIHVHQVTERMMAALVRIPEQLHGRRLHVENRRIHEDHGLSVHDARGTHIRESPIGDKGDWQPPKIPA